jgi:hypothetical protein
VLLALLAIAGCGGSDEDSRPGHKPLATMGPLGMPSPALIGQNVVFVDATIDGHGGGRLLVDSGSPVTIVNGALFAGVMLPETDQVTVDIGIGELTIDQVSALQATGGSMDQLRLAGILGGNVLREFSSTFNYRDRTLELGDGPLPDGVGESTTIPFDLLGGGQEQLAPGELISVAPTRIPLTAQIEGEDCKFVLDTGASDVALRPFLVDALAADGRAMIDDMPISTVNGTSSASVTRARDITLAGQTVTNIPVMSFDNSIIDAVSAEIGYPIDGLFGGDFLREFLLTLDYPHGQIELRRYATRDHIVDEFKRVGIWSEAIGATGFEVARVHTGSDAQKKGVSAGDEMLAIDGQALAGLDILTVDGMLDGTVGQTHRIGFGRAQNSQIAQSDVDILIEDLVPAPN